MADTSGGYAHWVRTKATDEQIIGMRNQREDLRKEVERLKTANAALGALKDPNNSPIPWNKAKADLRIEELEGEIERLREVVEARLRLRRRGRAIPNASYDEFEQALMWVMGQMPVGASERPKEMISEGNLDDDD